MKDQLGGAEPILCASAIRKVDRELIELLSSLTPAEWELPTIAPRWLVRDVAAHLLDTALRTLSRGRDGCVVDRVELKTFADVVLLVDRLNGEGVTVYRRLSPRVLTQLMKTTCEEAAGYYESLDPFATSNIGVSWAGEMTSPVWFHVARELTERWHHQQQIRLATGRPGIMDRSLCYPVLDTFLRGLPYTFRDVAASDGDALLIEVSGDCGGLWCLMKSQDRWLFCKDLPSSVKATIIIPQSIAWRIFTKGIDRETARSQVTMSGDKGLATHVLQLVAIVG
ncbi:MAG TPA: maleylpyruvate isomerase family mycothiol-dependent enzyme [Acidobacteriaceae bacterium]|nr:maleylpyruvate isomerase family mycothiol-dependent enzyme [Acidobacteriaceae bacterium]